MTVGQPRLTQDYVEIDVTPQQCRLRDLTYSAEVRVDIEFTRGKEVGRTLFPAILQFLDPAPNLAGMVPRGGEEVGKIFFTFLYPFLFLLEIWCGAVQCHAASRSVVIVSKPFKFLQVVVARGKDGRGHTLIGRMPIMLRSDRSVSIVFPSEFSFCRFTCHRMFFAVEFRLSEAALHMRLLLRSLGTAAECFHIDLLPWSLPHWT